MKQDRKDAKHQMIKKKINQLLLKCLPNKSLIHKLNHKLILNNLKICKCYKKINIKKIFTNKLIVKWKIKFKKFYLKV